MRVFISGTRRDLSDQEKRNLYYDLQKVSDQVGGLEIGVGDCPTGVDKEVRSLFPKVKIFAADWTRYSLSAGPIRNSQGVRWSELVLSFPDPKNHKGTLSSIKASIELTVPCRIFVLRHS